MIKKCDVVSEGEYLKHLFQTIRVVDPIEKLVVENNEKNDKLQKKCFELCKGNYICENCISIRAYNENTSFMKIEYDGDKVYMIMATPVNKENSKYVIETVRDITDCKIIDDIENKTSEELRSKIMNMNRLVVTDELTQCYNRRYINEKLPIDINIAQKDNKKLSIAMVDIDCFKSINDNYGHLVGDRVLKEVSNIIKRNIRWQDDWIARYGGEEFLIVFNNASKEEVHLLSNRIKSIVENNIIKYNDIEIKMTISVGIASMTKEISSVENLIEKADKNLYKAKKSGRNLVVS